MARRSGASATWCRDIVQYLGQRCVARDVSVTSQIRRRRALPCERADCGPHHAEGGAFSGGVVIGAPIPRRLSGPWRRRRLFGAGITDDVSVAGPLPAAGG